MTQNMYLDWWISCTYMHSFYWKIQFPIKARLVRSSCTPSNSWTFWAIPVKFEGETESHNPFSLVKIKKKGTRKILKTASLQREIARHVLIISSNHVRHLLYDFRYFSKSFISSMFILKLFPTKVLRDLFIKKHTVLG